MLLCCSLSEHWPFHQLKDPVFINMCRSVLQWSSWSTKCWGTRLVNVCSSLFRYTEVVDSGSLGLFLGIQALYPVPSLKINHWDLSL